MANINWLGSWGMEREAAWSEAVPVRVGHTLNGWGELGFGATSWGGEQSTTWRYAGPSWCCGYSRECFGCGYGTRLGQCRWFCYCEGQQQCRRLVGLSEGTGTVGRM